MAARPMVGQLHTLVAVVYQLVLAVVWSLRRNELHEP